MCRSLILLYSFFGSLIISCVSQKPFRQKGFIQLRFRDYDTIERKYINHAFMPDVNIWYKGNLAVEEIKTIKDTDSLGVFTREILVAYYLFMDRGSKSFYNYSSFTDTATILDKYTQSDTAVLRGRGGWAFYKNHDMGIVGSMQSLPDTTINSFVHKRYQVILKASGNLRPSVFYLRCDKKGTVFQFDKVLSEKLGCPIIRIDFLPSPRNPTPVSSEIVFLRDSLSKEELKVIRAWEKNLKKYPVNK